MSDIRHVVFDLGQVLIQWDPEVPYRRLISDDAERARFLSEICSPAWNHEQDRGRSWREAEDALIALHPDKADLIRAYRANWNEMIPGAIEPTVAILHDLADAGVDVTALTNWAADTYLIAEDRFPFLGRFRGVTVSGRVGLAKPEAAIFTHHANAFALAPEATLFFDDNPANIAAARAEGWTAEQYVSTDTLVADLRRYGVAP